MFKAPITRRAVLLGSAAFAGSAMLLRSRGTAEAAATSSRTWGGTGAVGAIVEHDDPPLAPGEPGRDYRPSITPNGSTLPYRVVDGVKVMHLIAEEVEHEFAPGLKAFCWGYNGQVHGPTIEAVEGDRLRIYVTNRLAAPTTIHWHGVLLPSGMDGVGGVSQRAIQPGETFKYEFTLRQHGTLMYHSHHDEMTQMAMGMIGMIVVHPRGVSSDEWPDRDFVLLSSEWKITPGTYRPDPNEMTDFNVLTFNAKAFPGTAPLVCKLGDKVRIRLGNLSMMSHHSIHLHGHYFKVTETDGGKIPESGQWPETTVIMPTGSTRTVQFVADNPGDWVLHCHMLHHVMNQMGHGLPITIGVNASALDTRIRELLPEYMTMGQAGMADMGDMGMRVPENSIPMVGARSPKDYITMGGMFTILKTREGLSNYEEDPGWYQDPFGSLADLASPRELRHDGVDPQAKTTAAARKATPGAIAGHMHGATAPGTSPSTSSYTCPMHPEIVSAKTGKCPKCGMTLVAKE